MYNEEKYIKDAFQALIDRGVATEEMFTPSTVTDEMLDEFEQEYEMKLPSIFRTYLKTYCYDFKALCAPMPLDFGEAELQPGVNNEELEMELWWCGIFSIPKEDPLRELRDYVEGFRETCEYIENGRPDKTRMIQFLPFADWMTAGPLCFDLAVDETKIKKDNSSTWQLKWFDHEEFDWIYAEYVDESGYVIGDETLPDFEMFLDIYSMENMINIMRNS